MGNPGGRHREWARGGNHKEHFGWAAKINALQVLACGARWLAFIRNSSLSTPAEFLPLFL